MNDDFIKIKIAGINGINHPLYLIAGEVFDDNCKFELYIDGKKKDGNFRTLYNNFSIEYLLKKEDKIVELYAIHNGKKILISKLKNKKFYRIIKKIKTLIKAITFRLLKYIKIMLIIIRNLFQAIIGKKSFKYITIESPYYNPYSKRHYQKWLKKQEKTEYKKLNYNPLISIIIPVYNVDSDLLEDCLNSVLSQHYQNFEICIADDHSTKKETLETLKKYENLDKRIKITYRKENGHISEASNSAIKMATGEYIAFLDNDDLLTEDALYLVAETLNKNKEIDMIYTDEDKMDLDGKLCEPFFKPDFSPDTLLSFNYITHLAVYRKSLVDKIGYLRSEYNGAQDFDFVLRFTEITKNIYHIPKIAYHWRKVEGSTALKMDSKNYALDAGKRAIENALKRRNIKGEVFVPLPMAHYIVNYKYEKEPLISIIIPTRDYAKTLETCLESIYKKTKYKNFEIIVLNNQSKEEDTFKLFETYKKNHSNFRVIDADMEFNYSKINNLGVKNAKGEYIVLLNNDTEVITPNWLNIMVGYAMQKHIGAVGAKLLYNDNTIQHVGIVLGIAHIAGHFAVGCGKNDIGPYARHVVPYNNGGVTAACLMVSKKKYLEVNGLDEELKVAFNDVEFNIKLLKKGYYNVCLPQVMLYHYESKSRGSDKNGEKHQRFLYESKLLRKKGGKYIERDPFYNDNLSIYYPMMLPFEKEE